MLLINFLILRFGNCFYFRGDDPFAVDRMGNYNVSYERVLYIEGSEVCYNYYDRKNKFLNANIYYFCLLKNLKFCFRYIVFKSSVQLANFTVFIDDRLVKSRGPEVLTTLLRGGPKVTLRCCE